jgi:ribosomal protein S18 acetylase RimI-like enzyme
MGPDPIFTGAAAISGRRGRRSLRCRCERHQQGRGGLRGMGWQPAICVSRWIQETEARARARGKSGESRCGENGRGMMGVSDRHVIRRVQVRDREAVARELAAYLAHIGEDIDAEGLDHDIAYWEVEYDGTSGVLLVVESPAGEIVGTAGVRSLEPAIGEIKRMWVRPGCQGLGLGRQLMDRCLEEARALGFQVIRLDTERQMEAALHLYRSYGFTEIPDYNGNVRAQIWMERKL